MSTVGGLVGCASPTAGDLQYESEGISGAGRRDDGASPSGDSLGARLAAFACVAKAERIEGTAGEPVDATGATDVPEVERYRVTTHPRTDPAECAAVVRKSDVFLEIGRVEDSRESFLLTRRPIDAYSVSSNVMSLPCVRSSEPEYEIGVPDNEQSLAEVWATVTAEADVGACAEAIKAMSPSLKILYAYPDASLIMLTWE